MRLSPLYLCVLILPMQSCGGGAAPSTAPTAASPLPAAPSAKTTVNFSISIPKGSGSSSRRHLYVSTNTESVVIQQLSMNAPYTAVGPPVVANVTPNSSGCTTNATQTICTFGFSAKPGTFNFSVQSYAGLNGTAALLAENTLATATIVAGALNILSVSLNGVIGGVTLPSSVAGTLSYPQPVTFSVQDPSSATIIGTGTYDNGPLVLTDLSGLVTLSPSSFAGPSNTSSFSLQCNDPGNGTIQFGDTSAVLGTLSYTCSTNSISLSPGTLDFDALATGQSDPTYDQLVAVTDSNQNVTSQSPLLSCTPGQGAQSSTIALAVAGAAETWAIRPLDVGTCTFAVQDQFSNGSTLTSQVIPIEIHVANITIEGRRSVRNK